MKRAVFTLALLYLALGTQGGDHPQFGEAWSRNMVSAERGLVSDFDPASGRNVKWVAELGTESHSTPVIAGGRVFVGTNNGRPRDPKHEGDRGVFMCFEEETGKLLWQLVCPKLEQDPYMDWPNDGIPSPGTVEGERIYLVSNRGQLLCLDVHGMANGNDGPFKAEGALMTRRPTNGAPVVEMEAGPLDADVIWQFDMFKDAGIWPHDGAHSAILIHGNHLYLNTGTGVDNTHRKIRTPDAPSLIVVDKRTGKWLAREREGIAPNIFHATWAGPSLGMIGGKEVVFFLGGNGIVYGFEPLPENSADAEVATLKKIFEHDFDPGAPKTEVHRFTTNKREGPSNFYGMPVFADGALFVAGGGDIFWGKNEAWLKRLDFETTGGVVKAKESWSLPVGRHALSTPAVHNGLVYVADTMKEVHCVDAKTGTTLWKHEMRAEFWSSPLVADGKLFIGSRRGDFCIFEAGREKKLLSTVELKHPISATAVAANGVLYVATMQNLYALSQGTRHAATLKDAAPFAIGVGLSDRIAEQAGNWGLLKEQFNYVTPENCMKPDPIQREAGKWNFSLPDSFVNFAVSNNLKVVGHTLVWAKDDRTPPWFGENATREVLLERMKTHIDTVAGRYRGKIAMWDVVNEALDDGTNYLRSSLWSRACGEEFIVKAFEYAHAADPNAILIYNDYNNELPGKLPKQMRLIEMLRARKAPLHAIGLQGHYELDSVPFDAIEKTLAAMKAIGMKVVISELDIDVVPRARWWANGGAERESLAKVNPYPNGCPPEILARQAEQYARLFAIFRKYSDQILRVTFWNLHDGQSWLNYFPWNRVNYPLLFDREGKPKSAFDAVMQELRRETKAY